jgi:hypothetical protein
MAGGIQMSNISSAQTKLNSFLETNVGISLFDLPDIISFSDWIDEDMTEKQIDRIIPDLAWELLEDSGMDRDTVTEICYPDSDDE